MRGGGFVVMLGLYGCAGSVPAAPAGTHGDAGRGGRADGGVRTDTDGDGLCDDTEARLHTDPRLVDTDGDGLIDSLEVQIGSDPLALVDPPSGDRLTLPEVPGASVTLDQFLDYEGVMGEVVNGAIQDRGPGSDGRAALGYASFTVTALDADPAAYVAGAVGSEFLGVLGRTTLHWRVTVQPADGAGTLGCRRGYGFTFVVRRSGGGVAQRHALVLDVPRAPDTDGGTEVTDGGGTWSRVSPEGFCLPAPPCT